ncbi:MAG TPA: ThuA domain-containing protein [Anaerolineales bacterium]|nr:ThuA domain-containing protein [Anaerolineales bacterium]
MKKNILLVASGLVHPTLIAIRRLRSLLEAHFPPLLSVASLEALIDLDLSVVSVLVMYFHHKTISGEALQVFERFVSRGGGVLAIHGATASYKSCKKYFEILGGRFLQHGKVAPVRVTPIEGPNAPFEGLGGFTIRDELYQHEVQPGIRVHFEALEAGQAVPVIWTYHYGAGRVCYAMPGHTAGALMHPVYQEILLRSLGWVSGQVDTQTSLSAGVM